MSELISDNTFLALIGAAFTVSGILAGWYLRAYLSELAVRKALSRAEQERNTLGRLYTHLKHLHDLREAEFRRTHVELGNFRKYAAALEGQLNTINAESVQVKEAEEKALRFAEQVNALELLSRQLQLRNQEIEEQLTKAREEIAAWQTLYRDFQNLQQRLLAAEQQAQRADVERIAINEQLQTARIEVENLQLEIVQHRQPANSSPRRVQNDRKGGPAAPEQHDDLKLVNGISPFLEQQLFALDVHTFRDISNWDDDQVVTIAKSLDVSPARIFKEDWVGQARHLTSFERVMSDE
jgi:predicted flap endonuclease-1-like 5' DNA nuclease